MNADLLVRFVLYYGNEAVIVLCRADLYKVVFKDCSHFILLSPFTVDRSTDFFYCLIENSLALAASCSADFLQLHFTHKICKFPYSVLPPFDHGIM